MSDRLEKLYTLIQTYPKRAAALAGLVIIALALPLTVFVSQRQQTIEQHAAGPTSPVGGYSSSCIPPLTNFDGNTFDLVQQAWYYHNNPTTQGVAPQIVSGSTAYQLANGIIGLLPGTVATNDIYSPINPYYNVSQDQITYAYNQIQQNKASWLPSAVVLNAIKNAYENLSQYPTQPPPLCTSTNTSGNFCTQNLKGTCSTNGVNYCETGQAAPADCGPTNVCCLGGAPKQPPSGTNTVLCKLTGYGVSAEQCVQVQAGYGTYPDASTCNQACPQHCAGDTTGTGDCTQHVIEGYVYVDNNGNGQYDPDEGYPGIKIDEKYVVASSNGNTQVISATTQGEGDGVIPIPGMTLGGYKIPIIVSDPYSAKEIYIDPSSIPNGFKVDPSNQIILNDVNNDTVISFKLIPPPGYSPTPSPVPQYGGRCDPTSPSNVCIGNNGYTCTGNQYLLNLACNSNQTCRPELNGQPATDPATANGIGCINATPPPTATPLATPITVFEGQICGTFTSPERICASGLVCNTSQANVPGAGVCINPNSSPTPNPSAIPTPSITPRPTVTPTIRPTATPRPSVTPVPTACDALCPNPPSGCHYVGGSTSPSNCTCGTLACSSPTPAPSVTPGPPQPTPPPTPTPSPGSTVLNFASIGLDGIGSAGDHQAPNTDGNLNPQHPTRNITVQVLDTNNNVVDTEQGNITYEPAQKEFSGSVTLKEGFSNGSYVVKVKSPGYLNKEIPTVVAINSGNVNNLPFISLTAGDIVTDNAINILDYNVFISCSVFSRDLGACNQNSSYKTLSDLNDNGVVDQDDYNLLLREWVVQNGQ